MSDEIRYHYNPETGKIGRCNAKIKCPLGENIPHFKTMPEAKEYVEQIEAINHPKFTTVAKSKLKNRIIKKDMETFKGEILEQYGNLREISWRNHDTFDNFLYLGNGAEYNVYLSPNDKFVYKIPNDFDKEYSFTEKYNRAKEDEEIYHNLDRDFLREHNCEYVETSFIDMEDDNGNKMIAVVQPYLNGTEYEDLKESPFEDEDGSRTELGELFSTKGFDDLSVENIKRRKSDGTLVLFDCIA